MKSLTLIYSPEDEWHGKMSASIESGQFRGCGSAWFGIEQVREFAQMAGAYPIIEGREPSLAGGYWDNAGEALQQCHLSIRLAPQDRQGSVLVAVTLGTEAPNDEDADLRQTLTARFLTSYVQIDRFRVALESMLENQTGEATLEGTMN